MPASTLRRGDKVVSVQPIKGVPVGTRGVIKTVAGQSWTRYWVKWETGLWTGTVDGAAVVRVDRLADYEREQAEAKAQAVVAVSAAATPDAGAPAADGAGGGRVPEHLLARSRQARARKAATAS